MRRRNAVALAAATVAQAALGGCAYFVDTKTQAVSVETPACPGAACRLTNSQGTYLAPLTPDTTVVRKDFKDLTVFCTKDGKSATSVHKSSAVAATYGNILFGGVPGVLVDGGSGAGYAYPSVLTNPLQCGK